MLTVTPDAKPKIYIDFEVFFFWGREPHKVTEICQYIWEIKGCNVQFIILTLDLSRATQILKEYYEYATYRIIPDVIQCRSAEHKTSILQQELSGFKVGSRIGVGRFPNSNLNNPEQDYRFYRLIVFTGNKALQNSTRNNTECFIHVVDRAATDDEHIQELIQLIEPFKARKHKKMVDDDVNKRLRKQQEIDRLVDNREYMEVKLSYHLGKAESEVVGEIANLLEEVQQQYMISSTYNKELASLDLLMSNLLNVWDIYTCLEAALSMTYNIPNNINQIKEKIRQYVSQLKKINPNNWLEQYSGFLEFLAKTDKDIEKSNNELGVGKWISWPQHSVDCRIVCAIYKIKIYFVHYRATKHIHIRTNKEGNDEIVNETSENQVLHFVVDEQGVVEIDPAKKRALTGQVIYLGVYENQRIKYQTSPAGRSTNETDKPVIETKARSTFYYTTFLPSRLISVSMKQDVLTQNYDLFISRLKDQMLTTLRERIDLCEQEHRATLTEYPKFVKKNGKEYVWFNYNADGEDSAENKRFRDYLLSRVEAWLNVLFNEQKIKEFQNPLAFLEYAITAFKDVGPNLNIEWEKKRDIMHRVSDQYTEQSNTLFEKSNNPHMTLMSSGSLSARYNSSALGVPDTIYTVCRNGTLAEFKAALIKEKLRLGDKFDINKTEKFRGLEALSDIDDERQARRMSFRRKKPNEKIAAPQNNLVLRQQQRNLLQIACRKGRAAFVDLLIHAERADVNYREHAKDLSPLHQTMMRLNQSYDGDGVNVFISLVNSGADPSIISKNENIVPGGTILHFASYLGNYESIRLIMQYIIQTKLGNCKLDIFAKIEQLPDISEPLPEHSALYLALSQEGFKTVYDTNEPSVYYQVVEQFCIYGIIPSVAEIQLFTEQFRNDQDALKRLLNIKNDLVNKMRSVVEDKFARAESANSSNGSSNNISLEKAQSEVELLLEKLKLKNKITEKPTLTRQNSFLRFFSGFTSSHQRHSGGEASNRGGSMIALASRTRADTYSGAPAPTRAGSEIIETENARERAAAKSTVDLTSGRQRVQSDGLNNAISSPTANGAVTPSSMPQSLSQSDRVVPVTSPRTSNVAIASPRPLSQSGVASAAISPRNANIAAATSSTPLTITQPDQVVSPAVSPRNNDEITFDELNGININTGLSPLHISCITGETLLFNYLVEYRKVDLSICSRQKYTAFYFAALFNHTVIIEKLKIVNAPLMPKADQLTDCIETPLHVAIINCNIALQNLRGATNHRDRKRIEQYTKEYDNLKRMVESILDYAFLTKSQTCLVSKNSEGHTPLTVAALGENGDVIRMFTSRGISMPDLDVKLSIHKIQNINQREKIINLMTKIYDEHWAPIAAAALVSAPIPKNRKQAKV